MVPIEEFIAGLPKAELHLHLEGTVDGDTLWELARRHQTSLWHAGRQAVEALYRTSDFSGFLQAFKTICQHLREPEDYELVTYEALRRLTRQNVRYAEVTISAGVILWKGENLMRSFEGIEAGYRRANQEFAIRVQWIFDAVRQFGAEPAWEVAKVAASLRGRGVIGFGIGGDERQAPPELFREVFDFALAQGLRVTAHAGEAAGPESVWNALRTLGAERIGHGLTAVADPELIAYLRNEQVPLDVCITSNVKTGCLREIRHHPLRHYFDRGLLVSLNTDDPALFHTDLNQEYLLAHQYFGFTPEELTRLAGFSFRASFLRPEEKQAYLAVLPADNLHIEAAEFPS